MKRLSKSFICAVRAAGIAAIVIIAVMLNTCASDVPEYLMIGECNFKVIDAKGNIGGLKINKAVMTLPETIGGD